MRATQKFGEHEQVSTRLNFASKSNNSKILRAVKNFNGPFITPTKKPVTSNNPLDVYLISKSKACPTGFFRIYITCDQVKRKSLKHTNMSLRDFDLPLKIRHNDSTA